MSGLVRADRSTEIRLILAEQTALLEGALEAQLEQGRQLEALRDACTGCDRTLTSGFAELNSHLERVGRLVRELADKR
ncbi:hypothetical protein [Amycolatopsis sp. NPDC049159]|uniref:hypothetical protein n=1 Tax=Amycolatopsis sp. NPDC049159 TaxID=3157210 RepID=UPI0033CBE7FE